MKKQAAITLGILVFLLLGTAVAILYGRGYRFGLERGRPEILGTGLLVATSTPDGAQVFINGHLTTATNNTLNLAPGEYTVKIFKEGYLPWEKKIKVQKEIVAKAEALLFPAAPRLESLTSSGIDNPVVDPTETKLAYTISSQSARKNGIYILDMSNRPILTLQNAATQIADETADTFSKAILQWSPDGQEMLATIPAIVDGRTQTVYLLKTNGLNATPQDVTETLATVTSRWDQDRVARDRARIAPLKTKLQQVVMQYFKNPSWSLDETRILYQASQSGTFPIIVEPRLLGVDATPEDRTLKPNAWYVYDSKEDKNYKITDDVTVGSFVLRWLPDSKHVLFLHDKKIELADYDGTNQTTIYAGPFIDSFAFPWPDGSKIVILTNLANPTLMPNLYTIGLK